MPGTTDQSTAATTLVEEPVDDAAGTLLGEDRDGDAGEPSDAIAPKAVVPLWKKIAAAGAFLLAVLCLYAVFEILDRNPSPGLTGGVPLSQADPVEPPLETLGLRFDEVRDLWNSLEQPPSIAGPLRRLPETGEFDSFLHRFDSASELVGAYRDSDDYMVALMVSSDLTSPSASNLYLHLCHMLHPFSPDCIDSYQSLGLAGQTLAEVAEAGLEAAWHFAGNEWRLVIGGGDITIRVLAPATD